MCRAERTQSFLHRLRTGFTWKYHEGCPDRQTREEVWIAKRSKHFDNNNDESCLTSNINIDILQ